MEITDSKGSSVNFNSPGGATAADINKAIANALKTPVGPAKPFNKNLTDEKQDVLKQLKETKSVKDEVKKLSKMFNRIETLLKNTGATSKKQLGKPFEVKMSNLEKSTLKGLSKMAHEAVTGHSLHTHDFTAVKELKGIKRALEAMAGTGGMKGGGRRRGGRAGRNEVGLNEYSPDPATPAAEEKKGNRFERLSSRISESKTSRLINSVSNLANLVKGDVFDRVSAQDADPNKIFERNAVYIRDLNRSTFILSGKTGDIRNDVEGWGKSLLDAGNDMKDIYKRTGYLGYVYRDQQNKLLKTGMTGARQLNGVIESSLSLSNEIGTDADSTTSEISEWARHFNMSSAGSATLANNIKSVSKYSGISGENLMNVVRTTKQLNNELRNVGSFSQTASSSFMNMSAFGQKRGTEEGIGNIQNAITSRQGFDRSSIETRSFLAQSARQGGPDTMNALLTGDMPNNPEMMKQLGKGMTAQLEMITKGKKVSDMTAMEKMVANQQALSQGFKGIGDMEQTIKTYNESQQTPAEKIKELETKIASGRLGVDTKKDMANEIDRLKKTEKDQDIAKALTKLTDVSGDIENSNKSLDQILTDRNINNKGDFAKQLMEGINNANKDITDPSKKINTTEADIAAALGRGDTGFVNDLSTKLAEATRLAASTRATEQLDPVSRAQASIATGLELLTRNFEKLNPLLNQTFLEIQYTVDVAKMFKDKLVELTGALGLLQGALGGLMGGLGTAAAGGGILAGLGGVIGTAFAAAIPLLGIYYSKSIGAWLEKQIGLGDALSKDSQAVIKNNEKSIAGASFGDIAEQKLALIKDQDRAKYDRIKQGEKFFQNGQKKEAFNNGYAMPGDKSLDEYYDFYSKVEKQMAEAKALKEAESFLASNKGLTDAQQKEISASYTKKAQAEVSLNEAQTAYNEAKESNKSDLTFYEMNLDNKKSALAKANENLEKVKIAKAEASLPPDGPATASASANTDARIEEQIKTEMASVKVDSSSRSNDILESLSAKEDQNLALMAEQNSLLKQLLSSMSGSTSSVASAPDSIPNYYPWAIQNRSLPNFGGLGPMRNGVS